MGVGRSVIGGFVGTGVVARYAAPQETEPSFITVFPPPSTQTVLDEIPSVKTILQGASIPFKTENCITVPELIPHSADAMEEVSVLFLFLEIRVLVHLRFPLTLQAASISYKLFAELHATPEEQILILYLLRGVEALQGETVGFTLEIALNLA